MLRRVWVLAMTLLLALCTAASLARPDDTAGRYPESAFWAEVAGLMVTLSKRGPVTGEIAGGEGGAGATVARYVIAVNEYCRNHLSRQSVVVREHDSAEDMLSGLDMFLEIKEISKIHGGLNISSMHELDDANSQFNQFATNDFRRLYRETAMSFQFNAVADFKFFSFFFQSDRRYTRTLSNVKTTHPQEWTCQPAAAAAAAAPTIAAISANGDASQGDEDCLWTPNEREKRRIYPYTWTGG